jgi:hypothetical protein
MACVHGEKLTALLISGKLPEEDKPRVEEAVLVYNQWIQDMDNIHEVNISNLISEMVALLTAYKNYIDIDLIFNSRNDFLYRQKGQLKLDNTVLEEFLPILAKKCIIEKYGILNWNLSRTPWKLRVTAPGIV